MFQELKFQLSTAILTILTVAAAVSAVINFQQQQIFRLPDDGVTWVERPAGIEALYVEPHSPAENAGLRTGDLLRKINGLPSAQATQITQVLVGIGSWNKAEYVVHRRGVDFKTTVIIGEVPKDRAVSYQYVVGVAYLIIGLFVYF